MDVANKQYLAVPFSDKEIAKSFGAKWDNNNKKWYAPNGEQHLIELWPINTDPIYELVGEDRDYGGNVLYVDLIPESCWFTNVRTCVSPGDWDRLRNYVYSRVNNICECCGSRTDLEAHERWSFNDQTRTQILERIVGLCNSCHEVTHIGLANVRGRGDIAMRHLMRVTGMDSIKAKNHVDEAFALWEERNKYQWELDLSIITNSGIRLMQKLSINERLEIANRHKLTESNETEQNLSSEPLPEIKKVGFIRRKLLARKDRKTIKKSVKYMIDYLYSDVVYNNKRYMHPSIPVRCPNLTAEVTDKDLCARLPLVYVLESDNAVSVCVNEYKLRAEIITQIMIDEHLILDVINKLCDLMADRSAQIVREIGFSRLPVI